MDVTIRRAGPADGEAVAAMNEAMALETEGLVLPPARVRAGVAAALADSDKAFYLLAEAGGQGLCQLMVTTEWSDWRDGRFWWIQSVYVRPEGRRHGVYRALYARLLQEAEGDPGVCGVRLYVHRDNAAARATYEALGMAHSHYEMYEVDFVLARR
jgi:ribosomal protein S18 acetylase RimI-like enzyme